MRILMIALIIPVLCCCNQGHSGKEGSPDEPVKTIISGYLPQLEDSVVTVHLTTHNYESLLVPRNDHTTQTKNGIFIFELLQKELKSISCTVGETRLGKNFYRKGTIPVMTGDRINIIVPELDKPDISNIRFYGEGSGKLKVLRNITERSNALSEGIDIRKLSLEQRLDRYITTKKMIKDMIRDARYPLHAEEMVLLEYHTLETLYNYAQRMLLREDPADPEIRRIYEQKFRQHLPIKKDMQHPEYVDGNSFFYHALRHVILKNAMERERPYDKDYRKHRAKMYDLLSREFRDHPLKSKTLAGYLNHVARLDGWDDTLHLLTKQFFSDIAATDPYRRQIETLRSKMLANLSRGAAAYNFVLQDTTGNEWSLEDFRGKVVLIDFMSYGCVGCYKLVPRIQEIEHEFEGEDVAFISISADRSREKFKKAVGKFCSPRSLALYTNGKGTDHPVIENYGVKAYPTLVLIDKDGSIIEGRVSLLGTPEKRGKLKEMIRSAL